MSSERDRRDLASPQPQPREQQQDREITPADRPPPIAAANSRFTPPAPARAAASDLADPRPPGTAHTNGSVSAPVRYRYRNNDRSPHVTPAPSTRCVSGTRPPRTSSHPRLQPLKPRTVGAHPARQEQPRRRLITSDRSSVSPRSSTRYRPIVRQIRSSGPPPQPAPRSRHYPHSRRYPNGSAVLRTDSHDEYPATRRTAKNAHTLGGQLARREPLALKPPAQQIQLPQPAS